MTTITAQQVELLHHTLGVNPERRDPFRNHFVAGAGHHAQPDLEQLEAAGMMERAAAPKFLIDGGVVFRVTDAGRNYALQHLPQPRKRSRWEQYLHAESGLTFAEWLGIDAPVREYRGYWGRDRMVRLKSRRATGDWAKTIKEAKASYKEALKRLREQHNYIWEST